ncbi:MAG: LysM peptidoglycan-binding domain-containing protein [Anaerolineaceae bacterium]|nr:LysM peptidoglycan-binding domain-containing protein [Anaerolineaceae bacterium]
MKRNLKRIKVKLVITAIFTLGLVLVVLNRISPDSISSVFAQDYSGADVVWAMNDIRALYGLEPYVIRDDLMQLAQDHAEYMAEIQTLTHVRSDGTQPNVTSENISLGPIQIAINTWMDDQDHKDTILAWSQGWAGGGVALSENGYVYISFDMIRMDGVKKTQIFDPYPPQATIDPDAPTLVPGESTPTSAANQYVNGIAISTPDADGYVWHEVLNGQTLSALAYEYESTVSTIIGLNSLNPDDSTIRVGWKLLIKIVEPPTQAPPTKTPTLTPQVITKTETPANGATTERQTKTPKVFETKISGDEDTESSAFQKSWIGAIVLIVSLGAVGIVGFLKTKKST